MAFEKLNQWLRATKCYDIENLEQLNLHVDNLKAVNDGNRLEYKPYDDAVKFCAVLDAAYWNPSPTPLVSDEDYDRLVFEIERFEQRTHYVNSASPTQRVKDTPVAGRKSVRRMIPMLSTEKAQTIEKVEKWIIATYKKYCKATCSDSMPLDVEWKYDGVSASLVYQDGKLIEASTGKGEYGVNILEHCRWIPNMPKTLRGDIKGRMEIRGELVVDKRNMEEAAKYGYDKNPRSAASGIMANDTPVIAACNLIEFKAWAMYGDCLDSLASKREMMLEMGFDVCFATSLNDYYRSFGVTCIDGEYRVQMYMDDQPTAGTLREAVEYYVNSYQSIRDMFTTPTDGLVFKVADTKTWECFGQTEHHPKYLIAYKFAAQTVETTLRAIEQTVGETGKVTPIGYFDAVTMNGATYTKASIGSNAVLAKMGLKVGDRIIVSLRNDVIPHIDGKAD